MPRETFAARAAKWSAAHWKTATFGWLAFVVAAIVVGSAVGSVKLTDAEQATGEAARAQQILGDAGFSQPAAESVLVQSQTAKVTDPAFRRTIERTVTRLEGLKNVEDVRSPVAAGAHGQISKDGHSALVQFNIAGKQSKAEKKVAPIMDAVSQLEEANPGYTIAEFGFASATHELNDTIGKDFQKAEKLSVPITFLILLFAFGAFVAAGIPVLLAFSAVLGSIGLAELSSHVMHASDATNSVMLLIGMAVGVDYSLFYIKREREERKAGHGRDALHRAAATSGQAVLISGLTVLIAMAGMLFAGSKIFTSIGVGTMIVVAVSLVGSLTVLPALLGKLDDRIDRGFIAVTAAGALRILRLVKVQPRWLVHLRERRTLLQRAKGEGTESRIWGAILRPALRFPLVAVIASTAVLVVLALPLLNIHTKLLSFTDLPNDIPIVQTFKKTQTAFPGAQTPAQVVIRADDVTSPSADWAIGQLKTEALATGQMSEPIQTFVNPDHTVARVEIPLAGNGDNAVSGAALTTLRTKVLPATIGQFSGAEYAVSGETAGSRDFNTTVKHRFPIVFAFVLGLAFLLLLLTFRSIVVPIKAILLNLLSVAASYGVLVWIFQDGHLEGLINFHSNGAVVTWLPLFLFVVLFGLSMDYHVFILSRVRELVDRGVPTEEAVSRGIKTTASTVTAAAAVMVAVFAVFASLRTLDIKQMGVGLAVAVLLDATLIRGVLLPATMKLLGDWNWYLPRWLEWLPRVSFEGKREERIDAVPAPALD